MADTQSIRRASALLAALALQVLFALIFLGLRAPERPTPSTSIVVTQLTLEVSTPPGIKGEAAPAPLHAAPLPTIPLPPMLKAPVLRWPQSELVRPRINWLDARRGAANAIAQGELVRLKKGQLTGDAPAPPPKSLSDPFSWSHQPLTPWFDFDAAHLTSTVKLGRHCVLAFFIIIPFPGCVLGHLDPDPGRGDLFDSKFAPAALTLPPPPIPPPLEPWRTDFDTAPLVTGHFK